MLDNRDQLLTRGSASRYLGGSQDIVLPQGSQGPLSIYLTGMMNLRGGDTTRPFVFSVDPGALFQVNPGLVKP